MKARIAGLLDKRRVELMLEELMELPLTPAMTPRSDAEERKYLGRIEGWVRMLEDPAMCADIVMRVMMRNKKAKGVGA